MDVIKFSKYLAKLKNLERTGWAREKVPNPESIADHSFGVAILACLLASKSKVDQLKVIKMALIHDMGEAITGDLVINRGRRVDQRLLKTKSKAEKKAISKIFSSIGGDEFVKLFKELQENKTPEAKLVKQLDKLEMTLQAHNYEKNTSIDLEEFYQDGFSQIKDKKLHTILNRIYRSHRNSIGK